MALVMMTHQLRAAQDELDAHNCLIMELGDRWANVSRVDEGVAISSGQVGKPTQRDTVVGDQLAIMLAHNFLTTGIHVAVLAKEHAEIFVAMT